MHQDLQRVRFEVTHAQHPLQKSRRPQPQLVNCLGRPDINGIITLENGHYLIDSSPYPYAWQHEEPQNSQDND
jgi:hypothetical protein